MSEITPIDPGMTIEPEQSLQMSPACEFAATHLRITFMTYSDPDIGATIVRAYPHGGEKYGMEEPVEKENRYISGRHQMVMAKERCVNAIIRKLNSPPGK